MGKSKGTTGKTEQEITSLPQLKRDRTASSADAPPGLAGAAIADHPRAKALEI